MEKQTILVMYATGIKEIPLTEENMKTVTVYFELKDGVFYFSEAKQKKLLGI